MAVTTQTRRDNPPLVTRKRTQGRVKSHARTVQPVGAYAQCYNESVPTLTASRCTVPAPPPRCVFKHHKGAYAGAKTLHAALY